MGVNGLPTRQLVENAAKQTHTFVDGALAEVRVSDDQRRVARPSSSIRTSQRVDRERVGGGRACQLSRVEWLRERDDRV